MANHGNAKIITALIALVLVTSAHAQLFDQCIAYYNGLGGQEGVMQKTPSCGQGMLGIRQCCQEAKTLINAGPSGCLCDAQVWAEAVKVVEAAHIDGANGDTMNMFANLCGIPHYGGSISC